MRALLIIGLAGALSAYPFIIISILLSGWFNFYDNALSDLGRASTQGVTGWIFNSGLIFAGIFTSIFGIILSVRRPLWYYLCWTIPLSVAGIDLALIGIFHEDYGYIHYIVSVLFFILLIVTMLIYSYASWLLNSPTLGAASLMLALLSLTLWFLDFPWRGVAIQEAASSIIGSIWLMLIIRRLSS